MGRFSVACAPGVFAGSCRLRSLLRDVEGRALVWGSGAGLRRGRERCTRLALSHSSAPVQP